MSRTARRRAAAAALATLAAGLALAFGRPAGVLAVFNAETENAGSVFAGGWVNAGTISSIGPSGYGASLVWAAGNTGPVPHGTLTGQTLVATVLGTSNGTCPATSTSYSAVGAALSGTATGGSDAGSSVNNGQFVCYGVRGFMNVWYADVYRPTGIQVGLVPVSVSTTSGGKTSGSLDQNDTIAVTFNQPVSYSGGSITVCAFTDGTIVLGDGSNCAASSDAASIGKITSLSIPNANRTYTGSGVVASGSTLTITVGSGNSNGRTAVSGTGTYTGAGTAVTSSTGGATQCTLAPGCQPSVTASF